MAATLILRLTTSGLGGASTTNEVSATPMNNIFDNVSFSEAASGDIEYRAVDLYNSGDASALDVEIYMSAETTSTDSEIDLGIDGTPIGSTLSIATESVAPSGVTFGHYISGSTLVLPTIPNGSYARVWLRRTISSGATNINNDLGTIAFSFA